MRLTLNHDKLEPAMTQDGNARPQNETPVSADIVIDSTTLFKDRKMVQIRHNGECYRLAVTKSGKLILTK